MTKFCANKTTILGRETMSFQASDVAEKPGVYFLSERLARCHGLCQRHSRTSLPKRLQPKKPQTSCKPSEMYADLCNVFLHVMHILAYSLCVCICCIFLSTNAYFAYSLKRVYFCI